jgi:adenosylhomocysteine nucleosidase
MESVLILTPLAIEHAALSSALCGRDGHAETNHNGVKVIQFDGLNLDLAVGGHGKVQFALSTQLLIQKLNPRLVICAGAAGRLTSALSPLDVVLSEVTIEHDFHQRFIERPFPRFPGDPRALDKVRRRSDWQGFQVFFGAIASGDEDIMDAGRAGEVHNSTGALAVAWEGAGGARACRLHGVPYVEVRTITDSADENTARAFTENIKFGMRNVADVIRQLL